MTVDSTQSKLRAEKLGVLIADARASAGKQVEDCANAIGVTSSKFEEYELGEDSPSLPELELLAYFLFIPIDHFWGSKSLSSIDSSRLGMDIDQVISIRNNMIGDTLREEREESNLSLDEVAQKLGQDEDRLEEYELGTATVPVPVLENLAEIYGVSIKEYFDETGPFDQWESQQEMIQDYLQLPPELRLFVSKPVNQPYIELAQRLSEMSVEKLRAVGEVLLEITL